MRGVYTMFGYKEPDLTTYLKNRKNIIVENYKVTLLSKILPKVIIFYVIAWLYKGFNTRAGLNETASEVMLRISIELIMPTILLFILAALILWLFRIRTYKQEMKKVEQLESILQILKEKYFPFTSWNDVQANKGFINPTIFPLQPQLVNVPNNEQPEYIKQQINELDGLKLYSDNATKVFETIKSLDFGYPTYVSLILDSFIQKGTIDIELLTNQQMLIRAYNDEWAKAYHTYEKNEGIASAGNRGEERVENELKMLSEYCSYLSNVRIEVDGQSVETDNIIFSPNGIFILEVKNFSESGSYSLKIAKDGQWQRVYANSVQPMKDVTAQNNRHIFLKERLIREQWTLLYGEAAPKIQLRTLIVIANDKVMIENESDIQVIRISQIYHQIQKFNDNLSQDTLNKVKSIIQSNRLPPKVYPIENYNHQLRDARKMINLVEGYGADIFHLIHEYKNEASKGTKK